MAKPVVSSTTPTGPIVDKNGTATFPMIKWMQGIGNTVNVTFDADGSYQGPIGAQATIAGRSTLASIVNSIDTGGVVTGPGIDFARAYVNKDTDHIADGVGFPLAGGKAAYLALVAPAASSGQTIRFDGANWLHVAIAVARAAVSHQWLRSYDDATGTFTSSQPAFSDISGAASPSQVPALSLLGGRITIGQLPSSGINITITTAALTPGGTNGSMTFQNGLLVAQVQAT